MPPYSPDSPAAAAGDILDSWKEIAHYLNRDVRTAQRWELEKGLPVRRLPGGDKPAVYAVRAEIDAWRRRTSGIHPVRQKIESVTRDCPDSTPSIAVLPFEDLSRERDQEYLCDGLSDEIINSLAHVGGLRVVARTSAFAFKGKAIDVRDIGRQLDVHTVLEGGVQKAGERIRITVQLIDASNGYHLWSERFEGNIDDIFALEDFIARTTAEKLQVHSHSGVRELRSIPRNPEAHRLCLQAKHFYSQVTGNSYLKAIDLYKQAIELDPACARAWAGLADCYWDGAEVGYLTGPDDLKLGRQAAERAVELDSNLAEAHAALGIFRGVCDFDWPGAEREFRQARRLSPMSPTVRERYAMFFLQAHHRMDEALDQLHVALEADPLSPLLRSEVAHIYILRREYDLAIEEAQHALAIHPCYPPALAMLGMVYAFQGKWQELLATSAQIPEMRDDNPVMLGGTGWALASAGMADRARAILAGLKVPGRYGRAPSWSIAWIHQGLGEPDLALEWLERAVVERDPKIVFIPTKPFWDSLRADPRFVALLRTMRLR